MFYLYTTAAILLYSLHNIFIAKVYREVSDSIVVIFYRALLISLSCSPFLISVPKSEFALLFENLPIILLASTLAMCGIYAAILTVNYLPVGITNTLLTAVSNVYIVAVSVLLVGEQLSGSQLLMIILICLLVIIFGFGPSTGALPKLYNPKKGFICCLIFSVFIGSAFVLLGLSSRNFNPILSGYLFEALIAIPSGIIILVRYLTASIRKIAKPALDWNFSTLRYLFLSSMPAGIGTVSYALAMTSGSIAIAAACLNLIMVVTVIGGVIVHGEKLWKFQWLILFLICALTIVLRLVSGLN